MAYTHMIIVVASDTVGTATTRVRRRFPGATGDWFSTVGLSPTGAAPATAFICGVSLTPADDADLRGGAMAAAISAGKVSIFTTRLRGETDTSTRKDEAPVLAALGLQVITGALPH